MPPELLWQELLTLNEVLAYEHPHLLEKNVQFVGQEGYEKTYSRRHATAIQTSGDVSYGDEHNFSAILSQHGHNLAAVIMEPARGYEATLDFFEVGLAMKPSSASPLVQAREYPLFWVPKGMGPIESRQWLVETVLSTKTKALILDLPEQVPQEALRELRSQGVLVVDIDDSADQCLLWIRAIFK